MKVKELPSGDAIKSYRYLRLGMIGAVAFLGVSLLIEHGKAPNGCWQTSISAYYYTPVRAVFVGMLVVVGFALIVIKGRDWEDLLLNIAGLLAPVVAIVPTTDIVNDPQKPGCWSLAPDAFPTVRIGDSDMTELAPWVRAIVDNNFKAFLIVAFIGLVTGVVLAYLAHKGIGSVKERITRYKIVAFSIMGVALAVASIMFFRSREFFLAHAHGKSAVLLFVFLFAAVVFSSLQTDSTKWCRIAYMAVAAGMAIGAAVIVLPRPFEEHTVFALEFWEISMFAVYWIVQTADNWNERVATGRPTREEACVATTS
ncbi:MAG: hypothetical protein M3277_12455 [Actinomycetota bacterium]|nr:hypothetical protein [Actinomycetota bacterium]